jgi:F-type H+-transporting ATPase subunit c
MELEAAKMIGAGLAAIALAGAGVGIGIIFGNYLSGAMRNPSAAQKQFPNLLLGFCTCRSNRIIWISSCINHSICVLNLMIKKNIFSVNIF